MLALLSQTLVITAPVFAMLFLGILLKRLGQIDAAFIGTLMRTYTIAPETDWLPRDG